MHFRIFESLQASKMGLQVSSLMLGLWRRHHVIQTHIDFGRQADSRRERVKVPPRVIGYLFCSIRNKTVDHEWKVGWISSHSKLLEAIGLL